jgi:uncharacterized membrane protein YeiH
VSAVPETSPARPFSWLRLTGLILGIVFVFWLPVEDQSEVAVIVFSAAICTWVAAKLLASPPQDDFQLVIRHAVLGIASGLALAPLALLLMAIKTGIHGHDTPDFLIGQMQLVLSRWFYFVISGLLVSLGIAMWCLAKRRTARVQG